MKEPEEFLQITASILIRCFLGGILLLSVWFFCFVFAADWMYRLHSQWFTISRQSFDTLHYAGMAFMKISLFLFFLFPYVAVRLVLKQRKNRQA